MRFSGRFCRGRGEAAAFTVLPWVGEQCREKLGFVPYPGTVNLAVGREVQTEVARLARRAGIKLVSPDRQYCDALCLPARLEAGGVALPAAIILPLVPGYDEGTVELLAPVRVSEALPLAEDVMLEVEVPQDEE
ncbi:MAG: CTP-dependent riboflavin kinase [Clostridia bacterium]|nr:CTP-dependent riboflavin kinase [Clostridia bacterium]